MSAALESLVRQSMTEADHPSSLGGLLSFLVIGAAAAMGFVILSSAAMSLELGMDRWLVSTLCYAGFIVPVYVLHRRFSFRSDAPHRRAFPRYVAVQITGLGLAALFSFVAYRLLTLPPLPASLLVIALTSGVNFAVLRNWAFAIESA